MMDPELARQFFVFLQRTLPNLLNKHSDPLGALAELAELWRERREGSIADRSAEVEEHRAEVDARLEERRRMRGRRGAGSTGDSD